MKIDEETMKKWQAPYRGWHYYPDHVVPAKRGIKGFEGVVSTGVPTVFRPAGRLVSHRRVEPIVSAQRNAPADHHQTDRTYHGPHHLQSSRHRRHDSVTAGVRSDPYLMTGYDRKTLELSADQDCTITVEVDVDHWTGFHRYHTFDVTAGETVTHQFPVGFSAHWVRVVSDTDATATAWFVYR